MLPREPLASLGRSLTAVNQTGVFIKFSFWLKKKKVRLKGAYSIYMITE